MSFKRLAAGLALAPFAAAAQGPSYDYLDISYIDSEAEDDTEGDGFGGEMVASFADGAFFIGEYSTREFEDGGSSLELSVLSLGIGVAGPVGESELISAFGALTYEDAEVEVNVPGFGSGDESESGYGLQGGLRAMLSDNFELHARYKRLDIDDDNETLVRFGAVLGLDQGFSVTLDYETYDEAEIDELRLGVRFDFGV